MGHGEREIQEKMESTKIVQGQRGEMCEVMDLKGLKLPHLFFG